MANVQQTITQLPAAQPLTGAELVPIVQNGQTLRTTVSAISASPSQTQPFLTVGLQTTLPNSRYIGVGSGLTTTDAGAQGVFRILPTGALESLVNVSTGLLAKSDATTLVNRALQVSGNGLAVTNGTGASGDPTFALTGIAAAVAGLSGYGFITALGSGATIRELSGTSNQITITNGTGVSGNPTISLADNPVLPGTGAVTLPIGTNAQQPVGTNGQVRFNSDSSAFEGYSSGSWRQFSTAGGVTQVDTGTGLTGGPITSVGTISIANTGVTAGTYGSATLIPQIVVNAQGQLTSVTEYSVVGGVSSVTGTANEITASPTSGAVVLSLPSALTFTGKTITGGTYTGASISGSTNTLTNIGNSSLTNSSITINGSTVSLGGSTTVTATATNALTIGTGLSGTSYNGSAAVTISITNLGSANGVATLDSGGTIPLSQIPASLQGGVSYQGAWNASTNTPTLTSSVGTKGYYYVVSVAGSTNLNGITDWQVGDWAIFNGSIWQKIDNTDAVTSVNGYTGTVVLSYSDVGAPSTSGTNATGTWGIGISGNAGTVTNGVYTTGSYADPSWITSLATTKLSGTVTNAQLANSAITINGSSVSLGGSVTVTATASNALTIGTGLSGTSYNGSAPVTIAIDSTVATLTGLQTLTNKTISGASNTLTNIANASLTNSSVTFNGQTVALGASGTITANTTNALTIGTGLSGTSFNGSSAVTIAIANTGVTAASYGAASKTLTATVNAQGQLTSLAETAIAIANTQVSGLGTMSTQNANSVAISGGTIDGTSIGATTASTGKFTTLTATTFSGGTF